MSRRCLIGILAAALAAGSALAQQDRGARAEVSPPELAEACHVVRSGENLESITAHYLGSSERWRDNWKLNPGLDNPHLIRPGHRLKILVPRQLPAQVARLAKTSRRVEDQLLPRSWEEAVLQDLLRTRDGIRTYEASSAELVFSDQTSLVITEESLVIVGEEAAPAIRAPAERQEIEVVRGQADLESRALGGVSQEIEITLGAATATARSSADEEAVRTRARRPDTGGAQVMVYGGRTAVASAGSTVEVARGMGTSVPEGAPPAPPEKLLPAPRTTEPAAGSRQPTVRPTFSWQAVDGARSYVVEVCRDPSCGELERRITVAPEARSSGVVAPEARSGELPVAGPAWRPERLPAGDFHWRVTAVSASGLDGFPSPPVAFTTTDLPLDTEAPEASLSFTGPRIGFDDRLVLGPGFGIEVETADAGTGVASWTPLLDGEAVDVAAWQGPWGEGDSDHGLWTAGPHTASVSAVDGAGNRFDLPPVPFTYDPDPPVLLWGAEGSEQELGRLQGLGDDLGLDFLERDPGDDWPWPNLIWTSSHVRWLPIGLESRTIESDVPYIVIRADRKRQALPDLGLTLTETAGLWIHAVDEGSGVAWLRYQVVERTRGRPRAGQVLLLEAADALGNTTRTAWALGRAR